MPAKSASVNGRNGRDSFAPAVLKWRLGRKLTQAAAAARLGVPLRTFQDWEYGRRAPKQQFARELILAKLK